MKLITLYNKKVNVCYKHSICSFSTFVVIILTLFAFVVPFFVIVHVNSDLWHQPKLIYEQPKVEFKYRFIVLDRHGSGIDGKLVSISSFDNYNRIMDKWEQSVILKYWPDDFNNDGITDEMSFEVTYESDKHLSLNNVNVYLELDASLKSHHCTLQIPAAIIIQNQLIPEDFTNGQVIINGQLIHQQNTKFYCPIFMRSISSHFQLDLTNDNNTDIRDFSLNEIQKKLMNNPGYLAFKMDDLHLNKNDVDNKITIKIVVKIDEVLARYNKTFWQHCTHIWIEYFAVFIVFIFLIDKLKMYLFSRQIIRAWEIIPWKKIY